MTPLNVGMVLDTADTARTVKYYNYFMVTGGYDDIVLITLNGVDMAVPGAYSLAIVIDSLTVNSVIKANQGLKDTDLKIIAFGDETDKYLSF